MHLKAFSFRTASCLSQAGGKGLQNIFTMGLVLTRAASASASQGYSTRLYCPGHSAPFLSPVVSEPLTKSRCQAVAGCARLHVKGPYLSLQGLRWFRFAGWRHRHEEEDLQPFFSHPHVYTSETPQRSLTGEPLPSTPSAILKVGKRQTRTIGCETKKSITKGSFP